MAKKYVYHSTSFEKQLTKMQIWVMVQNSIDFEIKRATIREQARSQMNGLYEFQIHVKESDYNKADQVLTEFLEKLIQSN